MTDIQSKDYFILHTDFLDGLPIKAIRKFAGGDTYVIVYLQMLLKAQACKGYIRHQRIPPTLSEEIALELGETKETVTATLSILENCHLIERQGTESILFKQCQTEQEKVIDSE